MWLEVDHEGVHNAMRLLPDESVGNVIVSARTLFDSEPITSWY